MIEFTQYLLPNGRKVPTQIARAPEIEAKAAELKAIGLFFEAEILTTGHVSLTIENDEEPIAHEVIPNGPEVPVAVDRLINNAYKKVIG